MRILKSILIPVLILTAAAVWADTAGPGGTGTNYVVVPFDLSIFPMISTSGFLGLKTVDIIQLNIFAGYTSRLQGFQAGIIDLAGGDMTGFQAAAVLSFFRRRQHRFPVRRRSQLYRRRFYRRTGQLRLQLCPLRSGGAVGRN